MLIQCKQKREGGTFITLGEDDYHFQDDGKGNHVCEVENEAHIERLLGIADGFHEAGIKLPKQKLEVKPDDPKYPADIESWTNKQCNDWAKDQGLNPANKNSLLDFAESKGIIGIDENLNPANIIRLIAHGVAR